MSGSRLRWVAPWAAGAVIAVALVLAWQTQYFVDYETTLLPWLTRRGWVLYRDMIDQHPPLLPALLAVVGGGGDPGLPLRLVILGWRGVTLALAYWAAARWAGPGAGLAAVVLTEVWMVPFDGTHLWYDGMLAPVYLGVLGLLGGRGAGVGGWGLGVGDARSAVGVGRGRALALGLLLALGILLKQHAVLAVPFVLLALMSGPYPNPKSKIQNLKWFALGLFLPLAGVALWLAGAGALDGAWYWLVTYSLTGNYTALAGQAAPPGEEGVLLAFYTPALVYVGLSVLRPAVPRRLPVWLLLGLLLAATLPAWPRYGRYHFQAAVPLLAVAGGLALVEGVMVLRAASGWRWVGAGIGLGVLGLGLVAGSAQWQQAFTVRARLGPPQTPYMASLGPLRAWVDVHALPSAPILIYHLDGLLYRVLEREPPRPFAPTLPWIMGARDTEAQFWAGVDRARPAVALVSASGWDFTPVQPGEARLRSAYHEVARFTVVSYAPTPPVGVVALLRNDGLAP